MSPINTPCMTASDQCASSEARRDPRLFQFDLSNSMRPERSAIAEKWYPGAERVWPKCTSLRRRKPETAVKAVVIHATAGGSSGGAFSVMRARRASFHWLVPAEEENAHGSHAWATAPEHRAAWHVANRCRHPDVAEGAGYLNHASLGIELVNRQNGKDPFSDWQIEITAAIIRYAWARYPNLRHVVSHAKLDPRRRSDPGANFPWERLRTLVLKNTKI